MLAFNMMWLIGGVAFVSVWGRILYKERLNPRTTITNLDVLLVVIGTFVPIANIAAAIIWLVEYPNYFTINMHRTWLDKSWYKGDHL